MDKFLELAEKVIDNPNSIMSWILLLAIFVIVLLNYLKDLSLAEEIEKIKSELSKKEIKFTRHTELQIECLNNLYDHLVSFHFIQQQLLWPRVASITTFKTKSSKNNDVFNELVMYCQRNRILLTDEIVTQFKVVQKKYNEYNNLVSIEMQAISNLEDSNGTNDVQYIYGSAENESASFIQHQKNISDKFDFKEYEDEIILLRENIEKYFKNLVQ